MARLVGSVARRVDRRARNATVSPAGDRVKQVRAPGGQGAHDGAAPAGGWRPRPPRQDAGGERPLGPRPTEGDNERSRRAVPNYIVIDRAAFTLRYFRGLRLAKTYQIAVGRQGLETPAGLYDIQNKQINPYWQVPNSSWAGELAGRLIPPGSQDPLKARWMGFNGSRGIHGTDESGSLGSAASHGCIRMSIPEVIDLYKRVRVHTPVYVQ